MTGHPSGRARFSITAGLLLSFTLVLGILMTAGCSSPQTGQSAAPEKRGYGMGGVEQQIAILAATVDDKPEPWELSTPESAVRSYLDWVSYGYRIAESDVASATQTPHQLVRTDAYVQANLQEERLLDQTLESIEFGAVSMKDETAVLHAREKWTYRYVSIKEAGKTLDGPNAASYETTYTLLKTDTGWVVDDIEVQSLGTVK